MTPIDNNKVKNTAVEWAFTHGMAMKRTSDSASHPAFTLSPTPISRKRFAHLSHSVHLLAKLVHAVSSDHAFIQTAIRPIVQGDAFFRALLKMHHSLHIENQHARRVPLLIMRSDFMDDAEHGPQLIEFNGIAAGMGPFGQRTHQMHHYLQQQWPSFYPNAPQELVENRAIENLAQGIANACLHIKRRFNDAGTATFLMVVQENEDNVFDQHLLSHAIEQHGIRTLRRTFRELYDELESGDNHRLVLKNVGPIDAVYLRSGYQYSDYTAHDIIGQACCQALVQTRLFIEQHHVAVNATVSQQLATSKRVQMLLSSQSAEALTQFGLSLDEAHTVKQLLGEMLSIDESSLGLVEQSDSNDWVLKNQGEGGGHCVFGDDIATKLRELKHEDYPAWALMRRLHPRPRAERVRIVRKGELHEVDDLISEIGMFTVHFNGEAALEQHGYAGYLIRSKSAQVSEGGVHSGMGALDSLVFID